MSHVELQHVIVRMLYDPAFTERVYADPKAATEDCDLSDDERSWLVAADRRAWAIDPLRRARSMAGLIEEFPMTSARLVRALGVGAATERLDQYFSSETFHHDLQKGSTLAASFGHWLAGHDALRGVDAEAVLAEHPIEHAIVRARWSYATFEPMAPVRASIQWAPGVELAITRDGALESFAAGLAALRDHPRGLQDAVLDDAFALVDPPALEAEPVGVLVLGQDGDVDLESVSAELATILEVARQPIAFDDLCRHAAAVGANEDDVRGIVDSFAADGVLLR